MSVPPPVSSECEFPWPPREDRAPESPSPWRSVAAFALSAVFHLWLLATLANWIRESPYAMSGITLDTAFEEPPAEPIVEDPIKLELANPNDRELQQQKALTAASIGRSFNPEARPEMPAMRLPEMGVGAAARRLPTFDVSEGRQVSERLTVPGTTGESLIQLEGALDRVSWEIATHLREQRVLVVWLLDASGSLEKQRATVQGRLRRIYGELGALADQGQFARQDRPLLSGVVAFGQQTNFLMKEPTDKFEEVVDAFDLLQNDPSGVENVFTAVSQVMDRWHKYRVEHGRRILVIVVTDEAGDDHGRPLDLAIAKCRKYGAMGYVIGPASPFGKRRGYVPYVAPENKQTYRLPVDLGPESAVVENVDLPYWYAGPQYDNISSGFGPYALSRFVKETGGVYFMTNMTTMAGLATIGQYDPHVMKAFEPDYRYGSPEEFLRDISRHPVRAAVFAAAQYSQSTSLRASGTPQLSFRIQPNNFRQVFTEAQKSAAISQLAVDNILAQLPPTIDKAYDSEPSMRWRLAFSLNYGRLLAQKVRAMEYNAALADLKGSLTEDDVSKQVNSITLRPSSDVHYAAGLRKSSKIAQQHLERVVAEAPGTPWALMAARELQDGMGIEVVKSFIRPPPPRPAAPQPKAKPKPKFANEKPAPPPLKPPVPAPPPPLPKL